MRTQLTIVQLQVLKIDLIFCVKHRSLYQLCLKSLLSVSEEPWDTEWAEPDGQAAHTNCECSFLYVELQYGDVILILHLIVVHFRCNNAKCKTVWNKG